MTMENVLNMLCSLGFHYFLIVSKSTMQQMCNEGFCLYIWNVLWSNKHYLLDVHAVIAILKMVVMMMVEFNTHTIRR
jgi:hypothetical protein